MVVPSFPVPATLKSLSLPVCARSCIHASSPLNVECTACKDRLRAYCGERGAPAQVCACMQHPNTASASTCGVARAFPLGPTAGVHLPVAPGLMNMSGMRLTDSTGFALGLDCPGWAFHTVHQ